MKKFVKILTHPIFLSLLGLLLTALLVWFAGPQIKFGTDNNAPLASAVVRLGIIMGLLVLWGLNNLRIQMQTNKQNNDLVEDIQVNHELEQKNAANEQASQEIQQMNQRFTQALSTLKKLRFSGGNASKALYELPWYIIVGPPGSGKTTALVNSGLDFPLAETHGKNALQGVGGTRNCDWWFTNEAVLIDTAGRYTTQDSHKVVDSSAWEGFLNLLKRNRKRRPINGALVAISLHDLLIQSEEERMQHAKMIRSRLDELMEKLEIRFPVYLVFTKVDLVSGFGEFFEDLSKDERDQVWGISLPNAPKLQQSPNFDFLGEELGKLIQRLYDRVLWRVQNERDVKRRGRIEGFPKQMENLKNIVDDFTRQTFVKNRYRFQPYLRGVYFSSGTQDGTPIDRLMTSVTSNFGFSRDAAQSSFQQGKTYFLTRLFREVIFPEAELVGANVRYEKMMRWTRRISLTTMALISAALMMVWTGSIAQHNSYMADVDGFVDSFKDAEKRTSPLSRDIRSVLPPLNALANASIVYDQEEHPWLSGLGMYDSRIDNQANEAYEYQLKKLLLPKLLRAIEGKLSRGHDGGDLYSNFRIYMMFNKPDYLEPTMVKDWFTELWDQELQGEGSRRQELAAHLDALLALELEPQELNSNVVTSTRQALLRVPVSQRVYSRIKSNMQLMRKVDMSKYLAESSSLLFTQNDATQKAWNIPVLYTIDGYNSTDFSKGSDLLTDVVSERWMLDDDDSENVDFVKDDLGDISEKVKGHYLADYLQVWAQFYRSLSVAPFNSLPQASDAMGAFADPVYSPLISALQLGKTNTQLTLIPDIPAIDKIESADTRLRYLGDASDALGNKIPTTTVDKRYQELNRLLKVNQQGAAPIDQIMSRIDAAHQFIQEISIAPDSNKQAYEVVKSRYVNSSPNPITALNEYAKKTPKEIRGIIDELATQSWKVIVAAAKQHIDSEWRAQVYGPYAQALAGRYPLSKESSDELALYDFSEFFKPEGTIETFVKQFVSPFVNTRKSWTNRTVDGYSLGFSSNSLKQIRRALDIKDIFFREDPETPTISLELKPKSLDNKVARFTMDVSEQRFTYNHGPKFWKPLTWSGADENKRLRVVFEDLNGSTSDQSYSGPWAWFRLMDDAKVERTNKSNVYNIEFSVNGNSSVMVYEGKTKSINNPFSNNVLSAFRCPQSL